MLGSDHNAVLLPVPPYSEEPPPLPSGVLTAEAVPPAHRDTPQPVLKLLLPVVMLVAVGAVVAIIAMSGRGVSPMMMIFPLTMVFGVLMMLNPPEKSGDGDEPRRTFLRHLDALANLARTNAAAQREHAVHYHPDPHFLLTATPTSRVWERGADEPRAGEVRLGTGSTALCTPIEVGDPGSPEDLDPVCAVSLRRTVAAVSTVPGMPIVVQLGAFPLITLAGPSAVGVARSVLVQLAFFHGPETVGIINGYGGPSFSWLKWLPHTRDPESAALTVMLVDATGTHAGTAGRGADCVVVVSEDPHYFIDDDALHLVCTDSVSAVTEAGVEYLGTPDDVCHAEVELIARHLAFYRRPSPTGSNLRGDGLLGLLGFGDIEELAPEVMWEGREGTRQFLTVPIGASPAGNPVHLDLKESAHGGMGPHGLCIGATGSGKSELGLWLR
ncbi:ESX-1 secretion system protein EccCa1 [Corynebacterium capitovis DSM 44611]|uniref:hypothetical protein n=1 Tax=Corynebacterium capitovis TaxID=131081 RepID=UPI000362CE05